MLVTLLPWVTRRPARRRLLARISASLQTVFVFAGAMSIGPFYAPSALALWVAAVRMRPTEDPT